MAIGDTSIPSRTVSAFFDTRGAAQQAVDDLVAAGIARDRVAVAAGEGAGDYVEETKEATDHKGFWESLKDLFIPDEDRYTYAEGLRRGGVLLTAHVDETEYSRVLDILEKDGAVDMDAREADWRQGGWTGYEPGLAPDAAFGNSAMAMPPLGAALGETGGRPTIAGGEPQWLGRRDETQNRVGPRGYIVDRAGNVTEAAAGEAPSGSFSKADANSIMPHMDVIASDGNKVGTVDHLDGPDKIKLAKTTSPDSQHHYVPLDWVDHVDAHVHLTKTTAQVMSGW